MKRTVLSIATLSLLTACATSPDKMTAASVSPLKYKSYDCEQIGAESHRINHKIMNLYNQLKREADNDAWQMGVGMVLFWPTLFFLEGGDGPEAGEYRILKGEYEALQQASIQKKCGLEFQDIEKELKSRAEKDREKIRAKKRKK